MKKVLFVCVCGAALFCGSASAITFTSAPVLSVPTQDSVKVLPSENMALTKAMEIHNLMTQLPYLETMAMAQKEMDKYSKQMQEYQEKLQQCNKKRFSRFKNSDEMFQKVRQEYQKRTADIDNQAASSRDEDIIPLSIRERNKRIVAKKKIEQELMTDVLSNGQKYGGVQKDEKNKIVSVPEDLELKLTGTGFEEMMIVEDSMGNNKIAEQDFNKTFDLLQKEYVQRLADAGFKFPTFDATKQSDRDAVKKALKAAKAQAIQEAKDYIVQLDAQEQAYPQIAEKRRNRSAAKKKIVGAAEKQFPELFADLRQFDVDSPQKHQKAVIAALEKDSEGVVSLVETNVSDVDQKIAESKANADMLVKLQDEMNKINSDRMQRFDVKDIDLDNCAM